MRLYRWRKHIESLHSLMIAREVVLHHFHRLKLLEARLLGYLVLAVVGIMLEMPHIGDVAHIAHLVAEMAQIAEEDIERYGRTRMSEMAVAINGGAAHIHAYTPLVYGLERLLGAGKGIVNA